MTDLYPSNPKLWMPVHSESLADYARRGDWDQFAAKLEENHRAVEDHRHPQAGGKPYATFVIAASNSIAADRANADYVCDGAADNVEIQAALDACTNGGRVLLLEGTYQLSSGLTMVNALVTLEGQGTGSILSLSSGVTGVTIFGNYCRLANLYIVGTTSTLGVSLSTGTDIRLVGVQVGASGAGGISVGSTADLAALLDCYVITGTGDGITVASTAARIVSCGVRNSASGSGIVLTATATWAGVIDCTVYRAGKHGVVLDGAKNCQVHGNRVLASSRDTTNTYDGILLSGDADDNNVQGNLVRKDTLGNVPRYGINVSAATCDTNVITNNDLKNSGATGSLIDSGTGTVTTAGNRT